jgi:hypothetical protein
MTKGAMLRDITVKKESSLHADVDHLIKVKQGAITLEAELQTNTFNKRMTLQTLTLSQKAKIRGFHPERMHPNVND